MPSLMLRNLPAGTVARLRAYARQHDLSLVDAADRLLTAGLETVEARSAGGHARAARMTPEARSARARELAQARWARHRSTE